MATPKIETETCLIKDNSYFVSVWFDLSTATIEEQEKYYKRALKVIEFQCSNIIREILNGLNIEYKENNKESYESALNRLKSMNKRILIKDIGGNNIVRRYDNTTFAVDLCGNVFAHKVVGVE